MPINGGAASAVATVAAEVSMASLLMAAGAVDLVVVIDDDDFSLADRSYLLSLHGFPAYGCWCCGSRSHHRRRRFLFGRSIVFIVLYVYGCGGSRRVHGLCLTQGNKFTFIYAFRYCSIRHLPLQSPRVVFSFPQCAGVQASQWIPLALGLGTPHASCVDDGTWQSFFK